MNVRLPQELFEQVRSADAIEALGRIRTLRVAVVGESILDEYAYCAQVGKSGKEAMLVMRLRDVEVQAGGSLAIANHIAELCDDVTLYSTLGELDRREEFVRSALKPNVATRFATTRGLPTIVKRRYVDEYSMAKLFGVYHMSENGVDDHAAELELLPLLDRELASFDVVVVADYGHGLITPTMARTLQREARFLALNTQLNAANAGYLTLSKYDRASFACLHEGELRLDARDLRTPRDELMIRARQRLGSVALLVTLGRNGTALVDAHDRVHHCPSLADNVVERVGAGDAVLSVSSLAVAAGVDPPLVGVLGNLAGAQAVQTVGNRSSISGERLRSELLELLAPRSATA